MSRLIIIVMGFVASFLVVAQPQEVIITGFPLGVGIGVAPSIFEPYYPQLQALTDTLHKYPLARAIVTGAADGARYYQNNDSQNPGLAIGRAHTLRNLLVSEFNVDFTQIVIKSSYVETRGGLYRYASVRIAHELANLEARLDTLAQRPPVEKRVTEVKEIYGEMPENMGLQLGVGFSSSPFGGIPIITGAITWKRFVFIEGVVGHTFWSNSFKFDGVDLATRRRMAGGQVIIYPLTNIPVGIVGGWVRIEEISRSHSKYAKMSEGLVIGLHITPYDFLSIAGVHNPAKHYIAGDDKSKSKNNQFLVSMAIQIVFGGGK